MSAYRPANPRWVSTTSSSSVQREGVDLDHLPRPRVGVRQRHVLGGRHRQPPGPHRVAEQPAQRGSHPSRRAHRPRHGQVGQEPLDLHRGDRGDRQPAKRRDDVDPQRALVRLPRPHRHLPCRASRYSSASSATVIRPAAGETNSPEMRSRFCSVSHRTASPLRWNVRSATTTLRYFTLTRHCPFGRLMITRRLPLRLDPRQQVLRRPEAALADLDRRCEPPVVPKVVQRVPR